MPRSALTTEEIEAFRERITDAATHLFAEQGFEALTMRAIAIEIGCSPMTAYRYFDGKDDIFTSVRARAFARFADNQEAIARAKHADARSKLAALGRAYIDFALAEPDSYRVMFELTQPGVSADGELAEQGLRAWTPLYEAVRACVAEGELAGDPLVHAHLCWAKVHGLVTLHLSGKLQMGAGIGELYDCVIADLLQSVRPVAAPA